MQLQIKSMIIYKILQAIEGFFGLYNEFIVNFNHLVLSNERYYLSPLRSFKDNVHVGDSAIKKNGTLEFIIIKKTNGKVYNYKL